ncbi:DUF4179 domain-containing protein [Paenibacillus sp. EKM202P]|uniref:DUF4179 domain-containing protein n=1 Tax=unclassified Paenibacillus TaxID=185978 RepID=UPI0013EACEC7|nr:MULTISPECIES: DUF4179 domain-containing protein [unclassified Paenibacillus]KAF6562821.1 DUF4179 domain-containing protein [Paenibacillus sp. EKM202P]KAF6568969.1 DUF4179 domain-containing protein [Paenibacillus sp. EKM207P]
MADQEELWFKQQVQEAKQAAQQVSAEAMNLAMRRGIQRANRDKPLRGTGFWSIPAGRLKIIAVVLLALCIGGGIWGTRHWLTPQTATKPVQRHHEIPTYVSRLFGEQDNFTLALQQAAAHDIYWPVEQSFISGDYKVTIDGMAADSQRIIILYTAENKGSKSPLQLQSNVKPRLLGSDGKPLDGSFTWDTRSKARPDQTVVSNVMVFDFEGPGQIPDALTLSAVWQAQARQGSSVKPKAEQFSIPLTLKRGPDAALREVKDLNRDVAIEDQHIELRQLTRTPLRTDVEIRFKPTGGREIVNTDLFMNLVSNKVSRSTRLTYDDLLKYDRRITTKQGQTYYFTSSFFSEHKELWLNICELTLKPDKNTPITINTITKTFVKSPDERIKLDKYIDNPTHQRLRLYLRYQFTETSGGTYFRMANSFTDGKGQRHMLAEAGTGLDGFVISNHEQYPQPLTFEIIDYGGHSRAFPEPLEIQVR